MVRQKKLSGRPAAMSRILSPDLAPAAHLSVPARRLKEYRPDIQCISMQPDGPFHGLEGLKHMPSAVVPGIYDESVADAETEVSTEEAHAMMKRLAKEEGLFLGISSGANVAAAMKIAATITSGIIVTILCDDGSRYLSEHIWEEHG